MPSLKFLCNLCTTNASISTLEASSTPALQNLELNVTYVYAFTVCAFTAGFLLMTGLLKYKEDRSKKQWIPEMILVYMTAILLHFRHLLCVYHWNSVQPCTNL